MVDLVWMALRKAPAWVWGAVGGLCLMVGLVLWHRAEVADAFAAGRYSVQTDAERIGAAQRDTVRVVSARVDTITKRVVQRIAVVESLVVAVPESIRVAVPTVDTALKACTALSNDCNRLRLVVAEERAARESLSVALGATLTASRDSLQQARRPRWRPLLAALALGVLVGGTR